MVKSLKLRACILNVRRNLLWKMFSSLAAEKFTRNFWNSKQISMWNLIPIWSGVPRMAVSTMLNGRRSAVAGRARLSATVARTCVSSVVRSRILVSLVAESETTNSGNISSIISALNVRIAATELKRSVAATVCTVANAKEHSAGRAVAKLKKWATTISNHGTSSAAPGVSTSQTIAWWSQRK